VAGESAPTGAGHGDAGARLLAVEIPGDRHIGRLLEHRDMRAKVSIAGGDDGLEPRELDRLPGRQPVQCRHDLQPDRLWVMSSALPGAGLLMSRPDQPPPGGEQTKLVLGRAATRR
jgi:hypothetical protein